MRLTTQNGQLDLPKDFAMTMRRTNPFLSEEGDASLPCTLPASENNKRVLQHTERIDRSTRHTNKIAASLQCGPITKHGQLIIDTVHRLDGIDVSFAIENSDLYSQFKDKTLKEIFREANNGTGYKRTDFDSIYYWMTYLNGIYRGDISDPDFTIFPVAIAAYEENDERVYQTNNEISSGVLVWQKRTVREGDVNMMVPDGYGISPFLYLHRLVALVFSVLGYSVTANCFAVSPYSKLVVLNNSSDTLVKPVINYADLSPNCKLSEFLDFLLKKFHAQAAIDSTAKTVRIAFMEDLVAATPTEDITDRVNGDMTLAIAPTSRVVLSSKTDIEDAAAAEETFDKLMEKYGFFVGLNENDFGKIGTSQQPYFDCLVLRKATGEFFVLERDMSNGQQTQRRLGTNYFTYDRRNSDESEQFAADDSMPPMVAIGKTGSQTIVPFIGERRHFHTSYLGSETDMEQEIMIVQEYSGLGTALARGGTTQKHVPLPASPYETVLQFALDPYELYKKFWKRYNEMLLNNKVTLSGTVEYSLTELMQLDMVSPKMFRNQVLIPEAMEATLSGKVSNGESSFILAKGYEDGIADTDIQPGTVKRLKWVFHDNQREFVEEWWRLNEDDIVRQIEMTAHNQVEEIGIYDYQFNFVDDLPDAYIGPPIKAGQQSATITRHANIIVHLKYKLENDGHEYNHSEQILNQLVEIYFTATAY